MLEAAHVGDFYRIFPALPGDLAGKDVLDFGCGYGGKTVEYAGHARSVAGVEPFANLIELASAYASHVRAGNADFKVCAQDRIPYPDNSFDLVLSHDVLEHVDDPAVSLAEIARVLRPGGVAYIAFPPYDGALSHHLDYVTLVPGLHWLFRAGTLVEAVNRELRRRPRGPRQQPAPRPAFDGSRPVLPGLNGLTTADFLSIAAPAFNVTADRRLIGHNRPGMFARFVHRLMAVAAWAPALRDPVTGTIAAVLVKPEVSGRKGHLQRSVPREDGAAGARVSGYVDAELRRRDVADPPGPDRIRRIRR